MAAHLLVFACIFVITRSQPAANRIQQNFVSADSVFQAVDDDSSTLLHTIMSYMSDDDLALLEPLHLSSSDLYDISKWETAEWDTVIDAIYDSAETTCTALELESADCYHDCLEYNSIPSWLLLAISNQTADKQELLEMVKLYSVSAGPISFMNSGNQDMCEFFEGTYCYTPAFAAIGTMQHACCVPGTCIGMDAVKVVSANEYCYKSYKSLYEKYFQALVFPVCSQMEREMDSTHGWATIVIFCILFGFIVVASVLKRWCIEYGKVALNVVDSNPFIKLFNVQSIWTAFGKLRRKEHSSMNFLDGVRVFSMTWVVVGHSFLFIEGSASNALTLTGYREDYHYKAQDFYLIFIQYATYSVDTFFFLSGLLATLSVHRQIKKLGDKPWIYVPMSYLSRFLRLAPMMMFATAIQWTLLDQLPYGNRVFTRDTNYNECKDEWYKILFFYANLTMTRENQDLSCMGHLWYIQVDMQLFLLLPFLLWIFRKHNVAGLISSSVLVVICLIIRLYYGFHYEFVANSNVPAYPAVHDGNQGSDSYFKPWTRMGTYFVAVMLAFTMIMIDGRKQKFVLKAWQYWCCILMSAFILCSLVMWPYQDVQNLPNDRWGKGANSMYYALSRPVWGVGLALMTFAFKYMNEDKENNGDGQKSMVKAFLSLEIWQPLGKLTYVMYLIHIIVYMWWYGDIEMPTYYTEWNELILCIGIWFIVASLGLVLWFVVETPLNNMVTMCMGQLIGHSGRRGKKNDPLLENVASQQPVHLSLPDEDQLTFVDRTHSVNSNVVEGTNGASNGVHSKGSH